MLRIIAAATLAAAPASAQKPIAPAPGEVRCDIVHSCRLDDGTCGLQDPAILVLRSEAGGHISYGWDEPGAARFLAAPVRRGAIRVLVPEDAPNGQLLTLSDSGEATYVVTGERTGVGFFAFATHLVCDGALAG